MNINLRKNISIIAYSENFHVSKKLEFEKKMVSTKMIMLSQFEWRDFVFSTHLRIYSNRMFLVTNIKMNLY